MRLGEGVEWALHCCVLLAAVPPGDTVPAGRLAEYNQVPPAYLAKHLQALSRAGVVETVAGPRGGYRLARPPADITVLDVVEAVEGEESAFRCTEIRQQGPCGIAPDRAIKACGIAVTMHAAEAAWRSVLRDRTIADLAIGVAVDLPAEDLEGVLVWLDGATRTP
jgi:Rrf2 family protein